MDAEEKTVCCAAEVIEQIVILDPFLKSLTHASVSFTPDRLFLELISLLFCSLLQQGFTYLPPVKPTVIMLMNLLTVEIQCCLFNFEGLFSS